MEALSRSVVLIVENSPLQARIIGQHIETVTSFSTVTALSMDEVSEVLASRQDELFLAVCNLSIKGAPDGEAVDVVLSRRIPCLVLTSTFDEAVRNRFIEKNVLDYFRKGDSEEMDNMVDLIRRVHANSRIKVLLADDSPTVREHMRRLLTAQNFTVVIAGDGVEALEILDADPEIRLVVTDYEMPRMDGVELVFRIRKKFPKDRLPVIGVSSHGSGALTARFLKGGANDFLKKPFEVEEFNCRVNKNLAEMDRIRSIKEAFRRDALTGVSTLAHALEEARGRSLVPALLRLDDLAALNAARGLAAGDAALRKLAGVIEQHAAGFDLTARFGATFLVLSGLPPEEVAARCAAVQNAAARTPLRLGEESLPLGVSAAVAKAPASRPDEVLTGLCAALAAAPGRGRLIRV